MSFDTNQKITWCPGCPNFMIMASVKRALAELGLKKEEVVLTAGIGCHGKIFDYLDIGGIYSLHGRPIPTAVGIKIGNPKLKVLAFSGDGDTYSEGISHFIHACRYNADVNLIVHDNQVFALTTGQATPTSQQGFETKAEPLGEINKPLNPIKLALVSGATFIARANARDIEHTSEIIKRAVNHQGFSFIEIIQNCLQFNLDVNFLDKIMYKTDNRNNFKKAMKLADEWDYNSRKGKIPIGVIYQSEQDTLNFKIEKSRKIHHLP
jgi:2-oxoglutarate ferredoxin oxidoreductase subunit beta